MVASNTRTHLGVGLYSVSDAARLLGVHFGKVHRWVAPHDKLITRYFDPSENTLTFLELMELHFIKMFRSEGMSLQAIRKAAIAAAKKFDTEYPFAVKRFDTDGRSIFATLADSETDTEVIEDLKKGQLVIESVMKPLFRKLDYEGEHEALRYWPLTRRGRVVLDPKRKFGKPIDADTGVPTAALFEASQAGDGQDVTDVAKWFDVPITAVNAAIRFEQSIAT
jgi:uncharacterized protein (DUF433 family)/DNA-binding transcriptional MerR regulator